MFIADEFRTLLRSGGAKCQKLRPYGAHDHGGLIGYKHSAPTEPSQRTKNQELNSQFLVELFALRSLLLAPHPLPFAG
jgi:hypothetical protein